MSALRLCGGPAWKKLLSGIETVLLDCDGVLWLGNTDAIPGAKEAVIHLRALGKRLCFVTNNSSKSRDEYMAKFQKLGFDVDKSEIFPTGYIVGQYLKYTAGYDGKVYLIGVEGTKQEIEATGCTCFGPGPDIVTGTLDDWLQMSFEKDVGAVVVAYDCHISYMKMIQACTYLKNPDCIFIATNEDPVLPSNGHIAIPGTGSMVSAVRTSAKRDPIIVGKPHTPMFDCIVKHTNLQPHKTLMIGDSLNTDILFGRRHGLKTLLVLSGNTKECNLEGLSSDNLPDYYADSIADLIS